MTPNYDLGKIRTLLTEGFSDEELRTLAFDEPGFKPVFHQLAHHSAKTEIVSRLLEHASHTAQFDQLLVWAKAHNPAQYAVHEPYSYDDSAAASPYPGMQFFDVNDADRFFGRELLTAKLMGRLSPTPTPTPPARLQGEGSRFLAVVGASGSGKSSVVRAGLVPAMRRGQPLADGTQPPEGCTQWPIYIITPTAHPLEALAASLTRDAESVTAITTLMDDMSKDVRSLHLYVRKLLTPSPLRPITPASRPQHLLLVVDQFEELFTLCRHEAERRAFVDNLLTAVGAPSPSEGEGWGGGDGPTLVVITLRADFYDYCGQFANLREALARYQEYIGPMNPDELRRAIELPAQRAGYEFEPGLVDLILRDVGAEPGALPLLSHALLETWRRRQGRTLTLAGYAEAGGVRQAIAQTAESVFGSLTSEQQAIARRIFLRLTELGEGTQDTRRRATLAELSPQPEEQAVVEPVLQTLVMARLVTTDQATAEVAHEALIREWPTLRQWLNDNREGLRLHRQLSEAAQEWQRLNHDLSVLYRGAKLAQASEWAEKHPEELNPLEQQFLTASKQAEENERQRELAQARALAEEQQRRAEAEQLRAEEQKQAAARLKKRALLATAIGVIALIAAMAAAFFGWQANENAKVAATREAEAKRQEAAARQQTDRANAHRLAAEGRLQFEENPLLGLRLAMEGWALSSAYDQIDRSIREMAQHGRLLKLGQGDVEVIHIPDKNPSTFVLDRVNAPGELRRTSDSSLIATLSGPVYNVTFSPDETASYFVVEYNDGTPSELRRTTDGTVVAALSGQVLSYNVIFSPDEALSFVAVSYSDGTPAELRRTTDGTVVPLSGPLFNVIFSPDEAASYVVVYYSDGTPSELRRTADGSLIAILSGPVFPGGVTFSPDEAASYVVVSYSDDTPPELRRTTDGTVVAVLSDPLTNVTFSPDEAASYFVVYYYRDSTPPELRRTADGTVVPLSGPLFNVIFSPDEAASYVVVYYSDGTPSELRRTADGTVIAVLSDLDSYNTVTFSPDEAASYVVVNHRDATPSELRRTADGTVIAVLSGLVSSNRVTFSPDEAASYVVVSYIDGTPSELRRTTDGTVIAVLSDSINNVTFSPDEAVSYFVVESTTEHEVWQAQNEPHRLAKLGLGLGGFHFDMINDRLITRYSDGRAYLLDLAWLRAMGGQADKMPIKELVRLACEGPFASDLFDEAELKPYLGGREPQACK